MPNVSLLQAPPQPELHIANGGKAVMVRWKTMGPLASSYVIEMRESTTSASNFFRRSAPLNAPESLELCVDGLVAGRSYVCCIRSVAQDGAESLSSPWSLWLTLPMALQAGEVLPLHGDMRAPCVPAPAPVFDPKLMQINVTTPKSLDHKINGTAIQSPPEVTGQEDMMLFLD